jgi:multiple sugar transport system permease protein
MPALRYHAEPARYGGENAAFAANEGADVTGNVTGLRRSARPDGGLQSWVRTKLPLVLFTLPAWALVVAVLAIPIVTAVSLSVRNESLDLFGPSRYIGFENFRSQVFTHTFVQALSVTAILITIGLAIQLPLGLWLASILHRELRGTRFFRSVLLMPMLLTPVAVGLMWRFMFNSDLGIIDWFIRSVGLTQVDWLGSVYGGFASILIVSSWQNVPFVMLFMLAGLQTLPKEPFEAAEVDGANGRQSFLYITLPLLRPVILIVTMIMIVEGFKLFDIVYVITNGGPGTATQNLSLLGYRVGFTYLQTSQGAAIGVVMALMLTPAYVLWTRATRE